MLIPFPWKRQEHVPFKCPDSASCRQKCETQWIYCIYFVVLKIKGIQQQLIQNFQEIPSTFYELAVNYIHNSPINQKYRDFSRVSYYILPIYRALFRLQVINSIFCLLPSPGCRHLATHVEGVQCGWFGVSQIPGMDESWKIRTAVNTHIAGWKIHRMLMLCTMKNGDFPMANC